MDKLSTSDLLSDNLVLPQTQMFQGSLRRSMQTEHTLPEIPAENICYSDSNDIMETQSSVSVEQSDLVDKINDLRNEVCCLKELFTTKEEHLQKSITSNLIKCFMDMMSAKSDSKTIEKNDKVGDICPSTSRGKSSGSMRKNQKGSEVELRTRTTDNELVSETLNSGNKGRVIVVQNNGGSNLIKDNMANKENNKVMKQTGNVNNTLSKTSDCGAKETRSDGIIHDENAILSTAGANDNCNDVVRAGFDKNTRNINKPYDTNIVKDNECTSVDTGTQSVQLKDCANRQEIQLCTSTVRSNDLTGENQDCENQQIERDDVLRSVQNSMSSVNHEQEKYQERHEPDALDFDWSLQKSKKEARAINSGDLHEIEDITNVTGMISSDQSNSSATENTTSNFQENCPNTSHNNNKETVNIRYGKTPNNQKTMPSNVRTSKRHQLTTSNQGMSGCRKPKRSRRRLLSELNNDCSGEDLSDIVKPSPECSDENIVVTDHVPVMHAVTSKVPMSPVLGELRQQFRDKQKINAECLGCRCDFSKVNSRNFLSRVRSSRNTCPKHRVSVTNVVTALRRYQRALLTKKRSPDFDFIESPKQNACCKDSPRKIMEKVTVKPKGQNLKLSKVPFSANEIKILMEGVNKYGMRFSMIEKYCEFSTKRSARSLKQKYESILKAKEKEQQTRRPFTAQEEENLKEGVSKYGYKWKSIFHHYRFNKGRKPQDLKDKWRNLLKTC